MICLCKFRSRERERKNRLFCSTRQKDNFLLTISYHWNAPLKTPPLSTLALFKFKWSQFSMLLHNFLYVSKIHAQIVLLHKVFSTWKKNQICIFPISDVSGPLSGTVPAIVGLFIALSILLFLFCFMFKLFTQSRWARARAYADANQPPPTITLEGTYLLTQLHWFQTFLSMRNLKY